MTLSQKLKLVRDALLNLGAPVFHYEKDNAAGERYIVWAETNEDGDYSADNHKYEQVIRGTVDMFTHTEFDELADFIQQALDDCRRISWRLNSAAYEDETGFIHYEWEFWVF